jgi:hypothetical protein
MPASEVTAASTKNQGADQNAVLATAQESRRPGQDEALGPAAGEGAEAQDLGPGPFQGPIPMNADDLEELEAAEKIRLREDYRMALDLFRYEVCLPDRLYLANDVQVEPRAAGDSVYFEVTLTDAWSWTSHRQVRTVSKVQIHTYDTVMVEDLSRAEVGS